jgi:hypothetical protein
MELKTASIITALAFAMGCTTASAFSLYTGDATFPGTQLEDDDVHYLIDNDGDHRISEGDVLVGTLEIKQIIDILPPISGSSPQFLNMDLDELTGLSTLLVSEIDRANERIIFGQDGSTPMLAFYSDTGTGVDLDVTNCGLRADCVSAATDGAGLWASFSIDPLDPDTGWFFDPIVSLENALDPTIIAGALQTAEFGTANFALNLVTNNTGYDLAQFDMGGIQCLILFGGVCPDDGFVSLTGSTDILGARNYNQVYDAVNNPDGAFARSDADFALNPQVIPVPAAVWLFVSGFIGLIGIARRKKSV